MKTIWSDAKATFSHRLAMHLRTESFRLSGETPTVTFTFDDLPKSAATTGAAILDEHQARGTFYVSGGLVGTTSPSWKFVERDDIVALHTRGHEIGCHTYSHKRACDLDASSLSAEIEQNRAYFRSLHSGIKIETFAYPFGYGSFARKRQLQSAFKSCRSIVPGVNSGAVDMQFLRALPLIDRCVDRAGIERAFDAAEKSNGWLIFYTHDVADRPSPYGCSPALLNHALEVAARRSIPALNMAEALRRQSAQGAHLVPSGKLVTIESRSHARL